MEPHYWSLGTWRRIPVSMHWTVLIIFVWLYIVFWDLLATLIGSVAFLFLLVAHEYGHVVALRRLRIPIEEIRLYGIHGKTAHGYAGPKQEAMVAWAGVAAQVVVLIVALAISVLAAPHFGPIAALIAAPALFVLVKINIILMIVALLPIGPFDGYAAWKAFPLMRSAWRRRRKAAREAKLFPEEALSPDRRRELEESSTRAADELLGKLSGKTGARKEDV